MTTLGTQSLRVSWDQQGSSFLLGSVKHMKLYNVLGLGTMLTVTRLNKFFRALHSDRPLGAAGLQAAMQGQYMLMEKLKLGLQDSIMKSCKTMTFQSLLLQPQRNIILEVCLEITNSQF